MKIIIILLILIVLLFLLHYLNNLERFEDCGSIVNKTCSETGNCCSEWHTCGGDHKVSEVNKKNGYCINVNRGSKRMSKKEFPFVGIDNGKWDNIKYMDE